MATGISFTEFTYMILQAIDFFKFIPKNIIVYYKLAVATNGVI